MQDGWTALHWTCSRGNLTATQTLLEHGANVNLQAMVKKSRFNYVQCAMFLSNCNLHFIVLSRDPSLYMNTCIMLCTFVCIFMCISL